MKLKYLLLYSIILLPYNKSIAQTFSGFIKDSQTGLPVEYVNIGIPLQNVGTISNENGEFELNFKTIHINEYILFSRVGYQDSLIKISDLNKTEGRSILLNSKNEKLQELEHNDQKMKRIYRGGSKVKSLLSIQADSVGTEVGVLVKNRKRLMLKNVFWHISSFSYDTLVLRLNIYQVKNDFKANKLHDEHFKYNKYRKPLWIDFTKAFTSKSPQNSELVNVSRLPIYIKVAKEAIRHSSRIDLSPYKVVVEGDFIIAFEVIKSLGKKGEIEIFGSKSNFYGRWNSQGAWVEVPIGRPLITVDAFVL